MKPEYKLVAKARYIELVSELAGEIWHECYARRFSKKQLDAMVENVQSAEAIEADLDADANYLLVLLAGKPVGYYAWQMQGGVLYLQHLYLKAEVRGRGIGHDILQGCERLARGDGKTAVAACVGAKQLETLAFFKGCGYRPVRQLETTPAPGITWEQVRVEKHL